MVMHAYTLGELMHRWPGVDWREPQRVEVDVEGKSEFGYACRVCVVNHGLRPDQVAKLPKTAAAVERHIKVWHGH